MIVKYKSQEYIDSIITSYNYKIELLVQLWEWLKLKIIMEDQMLEGLRKNLITHILLGEMWNGTATLEKSSAVSYKELLYDPAIALLAIYSWEIKDLDVHEHLAALFIITKTWKQLR